MPTPAEIERAVELSFPVEQRAEVLERLRKGYTAGRERCRVQAAILVLADGDFNDLHQLVDAANQDYRDPLCWAEYPTESGGGTKRQMRERYQKLGLPVPDELT
jgi:hypothetical protein